MNKAFKKYKKVKFSQTRLGMDEFFRYMGDIWSDFSNNYGVDDMYGWITTSQLLDEIDSEEK